MDKKYSHLVTFVAQETKSILPKVIYKQISFKTVDAIPTVIEWNNFVFKVKNIIGDRWVALNKITMKL